MVGLGPLERVLGASEGVERPFLLASAPTVSVSAQERVVVPLNHSLVVFVPVYNQQHQQRRCLPMLLLWRQSIETYS